MKVQPALLALLSALPGSDANVPTGVAGVADVYENVRKGVNDVFTIDVLKNDILLPQNETFARGPLIIKVPVTSPDDGSGSCKATNDQKEMEFAPNAFPNEKTDTICSYTACYETGNNSEVCSSVTTVTIIIEPIRE